MKKLAIIFSLVLINCLVQAQDKLPSFTKIEKADLDMQDCEFDPGAEALVLIDFGDIEFNYAEHIGWLSESNYRIRIKVLKEKGVSRAQIKLRYRIKDRLEEITNVKGISFNLDAGGNIITSELERSSVYEKAINKETAEISFALPNVKVGTVFEYRYKLTRKSFSHIPTWNFQQSIPVRYSAYNAIVPEYFEFTTLNTLRQKMERESQASGEKGGWYIMHNVPGLKEEPYSSGREDFLQRIEFQLSAINMPGFFKNVRTTWKKIIEELLEADEFGGALKKNIKGTADLEAALVGKSSKEQIRIIYNYVQRNMQWNDGYGFVTYDGIKSAWDKKNGSIAEINFILINLLNEAGIKAKPLLISTRDNGRVNTYYPFLNQFNGVMVYVKDGDDTYIMNAADKYNPFNLVPYDVVFTNALVVDKNEGSLIGVLSDGKYSNNIFFTCSVEPDGKIAGQATIKSSGYARNVRLQANKKNRIREIFEDNSGINIKADSVSVNNESDELLPFEQKAEFSGAMQSGGEYSFLPFNLFMGLGKNLFIEENRVMDIDFYYPKSYVVSGTYYLPDDFIVNELPRNTKMIMPDTSIVLTRMIQKDGNIISFKVTLDIKVSGYAADAYPYIKEFFKKMYAILDERIVLKKK
ncbi:MAG: DUF3857 domain-containing protein [Ferruginibacter sp.]